MLQHAKSNCNKSCKEICGATSVMLVTRRTFSQWAIDWMVRCDWLQVASVVTCILQVLNLTFILQVLLQLL